MKATRQRFRFSVQGRPRDLALRIAALCLIVFGPLAAASEAPKKVLMLFDERTDWDANILVERGIRTTFNQQVDVRPDVYSEYIGTWDQLAQEDYQLFLSEFLKHKYEGQKFDVIIGVAAAPLRFLRAHAAEIFPNTPIVAWSGREVVEEWGAGPPMTGVTDRLDFRGTVEMVLRLQPNLQRLIVVSGSSSRDLRYEALAREDLRQYEHRITLTYLSGLSLVDIQHRLVNLPNGTAILLTNISEDSSGKKFLPDQVASELAQVANAPVYGVQFLSLGQGIVGGSLFNQEILGREAALVALRVLRGERAQDIPVVEGNSSVLMVDWRELRRWGISESRVPPGTLVLFREFSAWRQYRNYILAVVLFLMLESALVAILFVARHREKQVRSLLERRFGIEEAISECSTWLSECSADRVDAEIVNGLRALLKTEGVDRASWFLTGDSGLAARAILTVHRDGVSAEPVFYNRPELPWVSSSLLDGKSIALAKLDDLPAEAQTDKRYFEQRWVKSLAMVPCGSEKHSRGLLVLVCLIDHREWPKTLIDRLAVLGNLFANAFMRKSAQLAHQESEQRFRHLFAEAPIGITLEDQDGKLLFANPALCSMLGYSREELTGMNRSQFGDSEDEQEDSKQFSAMRDGQARGYQIEKRYLRKDGSRIWGRANVSRLSSNGQSALILATVEDITEKRIALEDLKTAHVALQRLTPHLLSTQEQERQRIARELHDDIGQRLSLLMMELDILRNEMPVGRTAEQGRIHNLLGQLDELVSDVHNMSHQLHSSELKHLGLTVALKEVCRRVAGQNKVVVDLMADQIPLSLPEPIALCFYRVAQEALTNAVRHSRSQRIEVKLVNLGSRLRMCVEDFGCGFDAAAHGSGLGLVTMYERLRMIGGKLHINSTSGRGTQLVAEVDIEDLQRSINVA